MYYDMKSFESSISDLFANHNIDIIRKKLLIDYPIAAKNAKEKKQPQKDELLCELYCKINKTLLPFVYEVIKEYEYDGSPLFRKEGTDRETLAQMVDKILCKAENYSDDIGEIMIEEADQSPQWCRKDLLKATAEAILLSKIPQKNPA